MLNEIKGRITQLSEETIPAIESTLQAAGAPYMNGQGR
jgi:hypothetical protein